jgi:ABC-type multidrug transport system fused ATPase/permease subunit
VTHPPRGLGQMAWLLRRHVAPYWLAFTLLLASGLAATVLGALLPVLMAPILDLALGRTAAAGGAPIGLGNLSLQNLGAAFFQWFGIQSVERPFAAILALCVVYVGVGVLKASIDFANFLLAQWIRIRAGTGIQRDLFKHLMDLSMSFFNRQRTGELVSRLETDTRSATSGLEIVVGAAVTAPILIAFYSYLLVRTSPLLVFHWGVTRAIRGSIRRLASAQFSVFAELASRFQETFLSIRIVKSFGAEAFEQARLAGVLERVRRVHFRYGLSKHAEEPARAVVNYAVEASVLSLAAWELLHGRLTAPTFFLFLYVGRAVITQLGVLGSTYTQLQTILAASDRVTELFDVAPAVKDGSESIDGFTDRIAVRDVSFDYGAERVLEHATFEVRKGELVALVGPSGAGKSTLADLLLRFYDPLEGVITIDGRDLRTLRQESYRRLFGVVSQEALLFNATIRENIAYGREGVTDAEIERAARIANADGFIRELPEGYVTMVGDRGIRLSAGQRQRVAIARAIVRRPAILMLDEATSALDSESERLVQQAIDRVIRDATSVVIAHRLSTVLHADQIVVLNDKRVEAIGRHAELLERSETYARLYRLQFTEAVTSERPVAGVTRMTEAT